MKQSLRARRMDRHHKRSKGQGQLNLVSLMDIFTILVFFLLVNSTEVEVLQTNKSIELPKSVAEQKPENTLVVMVNSDSILVNGRKVADTAEVMATDSNDIEALQTELNYLAARRPFADEEERARGRDVTIMGDQDIPYTLLKKIMSTCAQTDYRNISLAVTHVPAGEPAELNALPVVEG